MTKTIIKKGQMLTDTEGMYEITGFNEKGGSLVTVREMIFSDEGDDYELGEELYFTESEVKNCLKHETGVNYDKIEIE